MNDALLAESPSSPLCRLLDEHFSEVSLAELLGPEASGLGQRVWGRALSTPLSDFLQRPGKAFRAGLVASSFALGGGRGPCPERLSAIAEILHAGSLIIDDIEDDSSSRRGGPALHRVHGLPVALNSANWMYFWALTLVERLGLPAQAQLTLYRWAHRVLLRCHHGQALDLTANVIELQQDEIPAVVLATAELKTGALMELSAVLGAVAADAAPEQLDALAAFGRGVGVALQMLDDVGGLVNEKRGHKGHEDLLGGRPTWPWAWLAAELPRGSFEELSQLSRSVQRREQQPELLARRLRDALRGSGRVRVRRQIHAIFTRLEETNSSVPALGQLRAELQRMEKSYG